MLDDTNQDSDMDENKGESTGDSSPSENQETVPIGRFKEVYGQKKELERKLAEKEGQKGEATPDASKEVQAKTYLKSLLKETLAEEKEAQTQAEKKAQTEFEDNVNDQLSLHTSVKRTDFVKFLEDSGDDYSSVEAAMRGYMKINETAVSAAEKAKKDKDGKPGMPKSDTSGGESEGPPATDKGKSLWEIAQDAARALNKK